MPLGLRGCLTSLISEDICKHLPHLVNGSWFWKISGGNTQSETRSILNYLPDSLHLVAKVKVSIFFLRNKAGDSVRVHRVQIAPFSHCLTLLPSQNLSTRTVYFWELPLAFAFFFFFTRIGIPSTRNQWIRSPKPHLFKTAQSGLRPGPFARIWVKRYVVSKVPRFVWTRPQFTYYLIYHCRFFHLLCTRHYTSMCMNPRYSGKRNWRHRNGNQWYIHPSLKRKIT